MKNVSKAAVTVLSFVLSTHAWAYQGTGEDRWHAGLDEVSSDTSAGGGDARSVTASPVREPRTLRNTTVSVSPEVGIIGFTQGDGSYTTRGMAGLGLDGNIGQTFLSSTGAFRNLYVGVSTGAFYSHLGSSSSNLFGSSPDQTQTDAGANLLIIPADVKVGYYLTDKARVSVHGGGNVLYSSAGEGVNFGQGGWDGQNWNIFPNVGGDLEVALAPSVSLIARPDVTFFTTGETLFTGSLGVNVSMF